MLTYFAIIHKGLCTNFSKHECKSKSTHGNNCWFLFSVALYHFEYVCEEARCREGIGKYVHVHFALCSMFCAQWPEGNDISDWTLNETRLSIVHIRSIIIKVSNKISIFMQIDWIAPLMSNSNPQRDSNYNSNLQLLSSV